MIIKPTVGRVVWIGKRKECADQSQPEVALVTYVHGDRCVNVVGWRADGEPFALHSVPLVQPGDDVPEEPLAPFACWMPYQREQAEKAGLAKSPEGEKSVEGPGANAPVAALPASPLELEEIRAEIDRPADVEYATAPADAAPAA